MKKSKEETRQSPGFFLFSVFYRQNPPSAYKVRLSVGYLTILRKLCSVIPLAQTEPPPEENLRGVFLSPSPAIPAKIQHRQGHSICPRCMEFYLNKRGGCLPPPYGWQSVISEQREGKPLPYKYWLLLGVGARKPLSGRGVAPSGGRGRARN